MADVTNVEAPEAKEAAESETRIAGLLRKEASVLAAKDPEVNKGEIHTLNQLESDLKANPWVARALESHLSQVSDIVAERMPKFGESFSEAWSWITSFRPSPLSERRHELLIEGGHGRKEALVAIDAISGDYPTEVSGKPSHLTQALVSRETRPAVYPLGREVGHDGDGSIYITEEAFSMARNIYWKDYQGARVEEPAAA